jgi:hypothetical protein
MTFHIACPACGTTLQTGTGLLGKQVRCGRCEQVFVAQPTERLADPAHPPVLRPAPFQDYARPAPDGAKGTVSLVLGILGLIGWCLPIVGLPMTITGLVFGVKGQNGSNRGQATAGIVLTALGLMLSLVNAAVGAYLGATGQHPLLHR